MANINQKNLSASRKHQFAIISNEQQEGALIDLVSVFSDRDMIPTHVSASLHTVLNNELGVNSIRVSISQQEMDRWYEKVINQINNMDTETSPSISKTRGERESLTTPRGDEEMQRIYKALGVSKRGSQESQEERSQQKKERLQQKAQNTELAVLNIRIGDVDQVIMPITEETLPEFMRQMLNDQKPSLKNIISSLSERKHMRFVAAMNLNKKSSVIPTTMGVALKISQAAPILAAVDIDLRMDNMDRSTGLKAGVTLNPTICVTHLQKMESWMPFINTGVQSYRAIEMNLPLHMEAKHNRDEGFELSVDTPQAPKTTILGLHSLPTTFTQDYDNKNKIHREPKLKSIHHYRLEELQRDIDETFGKKTMEMPLRIHGHYHTASNPRDYRQLVQLAMSTENHVHVSFEPSKETPNKLVIRLKAGTFQNAQSAEDNMELREFYNNAGNFDSPYPEDTQVNF